MKLGFIVLVVFFFLTAAKCKKNCSKNKTTLNPSSTKSKCRRIHKREGGYDRGGTMCANKPFSDRIWSGVKWDHTEPEITLIPPSAYTTMGQFGYVYPHRTPKCVSVKDGHFVYRLARAPGVKCQKLKGEATAPYSGNFTFRPTKQMICNDTGYFVYADIIDTGGCPIADVLYDCQHPADQPVKIAGEEVAVVTPHTLSAYKDARDSCKGDFLGLAVQIFDAKYPLPSSPHRILFKTKSSVPGRFTLDEVETSVCQEASSAKPMCAPKLGHPSFYPTWPGVNWTYSDADIADANKESSAQSQLADNLYNWSSNVSVPNSDRGIPKCFYMNGTRIANRNARTPGFYCKKAFERYSVKFRKHMICGATAYFIYVLVDSDSGCPIADLLEDCSSPTTQPIKVEGEPSAFAAPRETWAYADARDTCAVDFYGLAIQIYEVAAGKRSILFKPKTKFVGRFAPAEVESIVCPGGPTTASPCGNGQSAASYTGVKWNYVDKRVGRDRIMRSTDYAESKERGWRFYLQYTENKIPYCTNLAPGLVDLINATSDQGYELDKSCIMLDGTARVGLNGHWHAQPVCNGDGYFHVFVKSTYFLESCRLSSLMLYCQTASVGGKNYTAVVPSEHAVYRDYHDPCPDDFFGLKVEIYQSLPENVADSVVPKSIIFRSPSFNGRLNLDQIEAAVCSKEPLTTTTIALAPVPTTEPCKPNGSPCTQITECCAHLDSYCMWYLSLPPFTFACAISEPHDPEDPPARIGK